MILLGELDGEGRLPPEPVFAQQLGVSRHHLREALRLLEQDGLVLVRPGRNGGIFLTVPTVDVLTRTFATILARSQTSIADLMAARLLIEPAAAAIAAQEATEEEIRLLEDLVFSQEQGKDENNRFHVALTSAAHNRTLLLTMQAMRGLIRSLDRYAGTAKMHAASIRAHRRIVQAVRNRDAAAAAELVRRHLLGFEDELRARGIDLESQTVTQLLRESNAGRPAMVEELP